MSDYTPIYFPPTLQYPVTIVKVHTSLGDEVKPHTTIFSYKYTDFEPVALSEETEEKPDERERKLKRVEYIGSFECPLEGKLASIHLKVGDVVDNAKLIIAEIEEPCSHSTQYGGLCALCGKAIEDLDYTGFNDKDRAPIVMAHGTTNLKVSAKEAESIEKNSTKRLLKEKRLSLVVDLDQTVIHATVDPTVGEWMTDPTNPNYEQVKEVKAFSLGEDVIMPPTYKGPPPPQNIRWYYVKLRPGLKEFFEKVSTMYELHIYTMATRAYALSIAKIIDPDGKYFGDRILSRDESGSLTQKSLKRLFPADTSMVVVIDDRGDVWNWSPNLIKVVPYDFFVGIGDINSSFLPRRLGPSKRRKSVATLEDQINSLRDGIIIDRVDESAIAEEVEEEDEGEAKVTENSIESENNDDSDQDAMETDEAKHGKDVDESEVEANTAKIFKEEDQEISNGIEGNEFALDNSTENNDEDENSVSVVDDSEEKDDSHSTEIEVDTAKVGYSPVDRMLEMSDNEDLLAVQESERTEVLEIQQHERPLAKLQENLDKILIEEETKNHTEEKHNLLYDDDTELTTLGQSLYRVHDEFFREVEKSDGKIIPDVKDIMTYMKTMVFKEYVFLFSDIIPLGTKLENADIVIWVKSFGATVVSEYSNVVTHVICRHADFIIPRFAKTMNPNVKLIHPDWLFKCIAEWEKVEEADFLLKFNDKLLLKENEVERYKKVNNISGDTGFDLDWDEMDKELEDFLHSGSEDEDDEDDDDVESDSENEVPHKDKKRPFEDSNDENVDKKQKLHEETSEDDDEDDEDVDEFEKELLEGFQEEEEEEEESHDENKENSG